MSPPKTKRMMIFFLIALVFAASFWYGSVPLQTPGGINALETVELGGVRQWISIRGQDASKPVLLFLHGGPGSANLAKLRLQTPDLEHAFVVVNWDQRGAGKSFTSGFDWQTLTLERYIEDAHQLVQQLKIRFNVEKIYLMGFSWGTVIGLNLTSRYPQDFYAFISVSQVVDYTAGERLSLEYVQEIARQQGNSQAASELADIDPCYCTPDWQAQLNRQRSWLLHFGGVYHTTDSYWGEMKMLFQAPEYSFWNKALWPLASSCSLQYMTPQLMPLAFSKTIKTLEIPVAFFVGRYDYNAPSTLTTTFFERLQAPAGKRLVWFEQSAHDLFYDEPGKLVAEINKFVKENKTAPNSGQGGSSR